MSSKSAVSFLYRETEYAVQPDAYVARLVENKHIKPHLTSKKVRANFEYVARQLHDLEVTFGQDYPIPDIEALLARGVRFGSKDFPSMISVQKLRSTLNSISKADLTELVDQAPSFRSEEDKLLARLKREKELAASRLRRIIELEKQKKTVLIKAQYVNKYKLKKMYKRYGRPKRPLTALEKQFVQDHASLVKQWVDSYNNSLVTYGPADSGATNSEIMDSQNGPFSEPTGLDDMSAQPSLLPPFAAQRDRTLAAAHIAAQKESPLKECPVPLPSPGRITHSIAVCKYEVKLHKLKTKIKTYGCRSSLKPKDRNLLSDYPDTFFKWMLTADRKVQTSVVQKLFDICQEIEECHTNLDIMKSQNGPNGEKTVEDDMVKHPKTKKSQNKKKKSTKAVVVLQKGKSPKIMTKRAMHKKKKSASKKLDQGVTVNPQRAKILRIEPKFTDRTPFSGTVVMEQKVISAPDAPSIIFESTISFLAAAREQNFTSNSTSLGSFAANAPNFLWFDCIRAYVNLEGNAAPMVNGSVLFVSSPVPLNVAQLQLFLTNRQMRRGWARDVKELTFKQLETGRSHRVPLNIVSGDRPIGINPTPDEVSPILGYFYVIQWNVPTSMGLGSNSTDPSAGSSTMVASTAVTPFAKMELHMEGDLVYRCGGISDSTNVVEVEEESVQTTWVPVGTTTHGQGFDPKVGAPIQGPLTPDLASQAQNALMLYGQNGVTSGDLNLGGGRIAKYFIESVTLDSGEVITFLLTTIARAAFAYLSGGVSEIVGPVIQQLVIYGGKYLIGFVADRIGTPDTAKSKTVSFNTANGTYSDGPPIGKTLAVGEIAVPQSWHNGDGQANANRQYQVNECYLKGLQAPVNSVIRNLANAYWGAQFNGTYVHWLIDNGGGPETKIMSMEDFVVRREGVETLVPTVEASWTVPSDNLAGVPALFTRSVTASREIAYALPLLSPAPAGGPTFTLCKPDPTITRLMYTRNTSDVTYTRHLMFLPADTKYLDSNGNFVWDPLDPKFWNGQCIYAVPAELSFLSEDEAIYYWSSFFGVAPVVKSTEIIWEYEFNVNLIGVANTAMVADYTNSYVPAYVNYTDPDEAFPVFWGDNGAHEYNHHGILRGRYGVDRDEGWFDSINSLLNARSAYVVRHTKGIGASPVYVEDQFSQTLIRDESGYLKDFNIGVNTDPPAMWHVLPNF